MTKSERERQLDALLDSLLSIYSAAEPRPGLEMRIRARMTAHSAQHRWMWTLIFAASAAACSLTVWMVTARVQSPVPTRQVVERKTTQPVETIQAQKSRSAIASSGWVTTGAQRKSRNNTRALLQLAGAVHSGGDLVFQQAQSYAAPVTPEADAAETDQPASRDNISIQNLGVESIEIKDLASAKGDEKGNSR
ncbi:MAG TPA: hypothetical protein VKW06_07195 [Candidatus Angelobacter sp.]|nr:hypothetical protein [Candidatus Angelobacter sp.]